MKTSRPQIWVRFMIPSQLSWGSGCEPTLTSDSVPALVHFSPVAVYGIIESISQLLYEVVLGVLQEWAHCQARCGQEPVWQLPLGEDYHHTFCSPNKVVLNQVFKVKRIQWCVSYPKMTSVLKTGGGTHGSTERILCDTESEYGHVWAWEKPLRRNPCWGHPHL